MDNIQTIPPPFVVRTLLIYSRHAGQLQFNPSDAVSVSERMSYVMFKSSRTDTIRFFFFASLDLLLKWNVVLQKMLRSPYFFFDVIYLHNGADEQMEDSSWRVILFPCLSAIKTEIKKSSYYNTVSNLLTVNGMCVHSLAFCLWKSW